MKYIYTLYHSYNNDCDNLKLIGFFSTKKKAEEARELVRNKSGFKEFDISCFEIGRVVMDLCEWKEGFIL